MMVLTRIKLSQHGNLPQIGARIKHIYLWKSHLVFPSCLLNGIQNLQQKIVTKRKAFTDPHPTPLIPNKKTHKTSVLSASQHSSLQAPHRYRHGKLLAIKEAATGTSMSRNGSYKAGPLRSLYTWSHNLYQWPKINGHGNWDYNPTANILGILTPFISSRGPTLYATWTYQGTVTDITDHGRLLHLHNITTNGANTTHPAIQIWSLLPSYCEESHRKNKCEFSSPFWPKKQSHTLHVQLSSNQFHPYYVGNILLVRSLFWRHSHPWRRCHFSRCIMHPSKRAGSVEPSCPTLALSFLLMIKHWRH